MGDIQSVFRDRNDTALWYCTSQYNVNIKQATNQHLMVLLKYLIYALQIIHSRNGDKYKTLFDRGEESLHIIRTIYVI